MTLAGNDLMVDEESSLVEHARAGSRDAFGRLVVLYHHNVHACVLQIIGDAEAARDLTQEVFLRAYTSLSGLRDTRKFRSWLYAIAINLSRDWLKRPRRATFPLVDSSASASNAERELPDPRPSASPSYIVETDELKAAVAAAVGALPLKYREVSVLRFQQELKVGEVAEVLDISVAAVDSRLRRAKAMLRDTLAELE